MRNVTFHVSACWDSEAKVYYSESDIIGLHIEAVTLSEFEDVMSELAPELIIQNHMSKQALTDTPLRDLIPTILWQRPPEQQVECA